MAEIPGVSTETTAAQEAILDALDGRPLMLSLAAVGFMASVLLATLDDSDIMERWIVQLRKSVATGIEGGVDLTRSPTAEH